MGSRDALSIGRNRSDRPILEPDWLLVSSMGLSTATPDAKTACALFDSLCEYPACEPSRSPPMKTRSQSVGALLEPWVAVLARHGHAKQSCVRSSSGSATAVIEFVLSSLHAAFVGRDDVAQLREALLMLHLAGTVDVATVEDAVAGLCYHDFAEPEAEDDVPGKGDSPGRTECDQVEFVLTFYGTRGRFLEEVIGPGLFGESHSPSTEYLAARSELLLDDPDRNADFSCRVNIVSLDHTFDDDDDVETDYVKRLVSFIRILDSIGPNVSNQSQDAQVCASAIQIELNELAISSDAVDAVASLHAVKIPVSCSRVAIDLKALSCSANELTTFIDNIGFGTSGMTVEIGHVAVDGPHPHNSKITNQEMMVRNVLRGISGASCVTSLSFGPLLAMTNSPFDREVVWRELFACLTDVNSSARVSSLIVSPRISLLPQDAAFIREAIDMYGPLPVTKVSMWLSQSDPEAVQSLIKAVAHTVQSITLHSEWDAVIPAKAVSVIASQCPRLEVLSLAWAEMDSLSSFAGDTSKLCELSLDSVVLHDSPSLSTLLLALADTRTPISRSLRTLHIRAGYNDGSLTVGEAEAEILTQVLETNKVLNDVELAMADGEIKSLCAINSHNNEVLPEPMVLRQKFAFLSAIRVSSAQVTHSHRNRVDEDAVRLIFAFAAERVNRRVYLDF